MEKGKKKRSQAPVAFVYFVTLLAFMAIFSFIAYHLIKKLSVTTESEAPKALNADRTFSIFFSRLDSKGALADAAVFKFAPERGKVIIVPLPKETVNEATGEMFSDIYDKNGTKSLKKAAEDTLGISIDNYMTVSNSAFESVYDMIGGVIFTPKEELYRLVEGQDAQDISYRAGIPVELSSIQATTLLSAHMFSNGAQGDLELIGSILQQLTNSAFQQVTLTKNSLDNIFGKLRGTGENDYTDNVYRSNRETLMSMLEQNIRPTLLHKPDGSWREDGRFVIAQTFKNELQEVYGTSKAAVQQTEEDSNQ